VLLKAMGDVERAIRGYEQLLAAEPNHAEAHDNLGSLLLDRDATAALAHFARGEQLEPNDPDCHLGCARALVKLDRKMEARWSLDRPAAGSRSPAPGGSGSGASLSTAKGKGPPVD
jgi:Flp pilus assembly protein TadD